MATRTSAKLELYRDERVRLGILLANAKRDGENPERIEGLHADLDELAEMTKREEQRLRGERQTPSLDEQEADALNRSEGIQRTRGHGINE